MENWLTKVDEKLQTADSPGCENAIVAKSNSDDNEDVENGNFSQKSITATEAIKALDKAIEWAEEKTANFVYVFALESLRDQAVQKSLNEEFTCHFFYK